MLEDVRDIIAQQRRCRTNTVQLCDRLTSGSYAELRDAMPGVSLVQVIHVTGEESLAEAVRLEDLIDRSGPADGSTIYSSARVVRAKLTSAARNVAEALSGGESATA